MRKIDIQSWPRRQHYEFFNSFNHPHFNMCANLDITKLLPYIKHNKKSFSVAIFYLISTAANAVPEFRQRIRGEEVVEHETVSPGVTILLDDESFSFCTIDYCQDFADFSSRAGRLMAEAKLNRTLKDPPGRDDMLFLTAIPWVSFTSFEHPMRLHPADSIPRFAWGKFFEEGGRTRMPLSVQGHHALMDGIHMAKFYQNMQGYLDNPEVVLGNG